MKKLSFVLFFVLALAGVIFMPNLVWSQVGNDTDWVNIDGNSQNGSCQAEPVASDFPVADLNAVLKTLRSRALPYPKVKSPEVTEVMMKEWMTLNDQDSNIKNLSDLYSNGRTLPPPLDKVMIHNQIFQDLVRARNYSIFQRDKKVIEFDVKEMVEQKIITKPEQFISLIFSHLKGILSRKFKHKGLMLPSKIDQFLSIILWSQTQTFDPEMVILGMKNYADSPIPVAVSNIRPTEEQEKSGQGIQIQFRFEGTKIIVTKTYAIKTTIVEDGTAHRVEDLVGTRKIIFDTMNMNFSDISYKLTKKSFATKAYEVVGNVAKNFFNLATTIKSNISNKVKTLRGSL